MVSKPCCLAVDAANFLSGDQLTDSVCVVFTTGSLGERIIIETADCGAEVILDNPIMFDLTNVAVWAELF